MFEIFVSAPHLEVPVTSNFLHTTVGMQKYCPVDLPRGRRKQYFFHHTPPSLVAQYQFQGLISTQVATPVDFTSTLHELPEMYSRKEIKDESEQFEEGVPLESIRNIVPELKNVDIPNIHAWQCPSRPLPDVTFKRGARVRWNDSAISRDDPARMKFGEGPFIVCVVNDNVIVNVEDDKNKRKCITHVYRHNHIALESLENGYALFADPGYFIEA